MNKTEKAGLVIFLICLWGATINEGAVLGLAVFGMGIGACTFIFGDS